MKNNLNKMKKKLNTLKKKHFEHKTNTELTNA